MTKDSTTELCSPPLSILFLLRQSQAAQAGLELTILRPLHPKQLDYRAALPAESGGWGASREGRVFSVQSEPWSNQQ